MKKMATQEIVSPQPKTLFGMDECSNRWSVSKDLLRRLADEGVLTTVYLAGRRLVPIAEVTRIDTHGLGSGRRKGWKRAKKNEGR